MWSILEGSLFEKKQRWSVLPRMGLNYLLRITLYRNFAIRFVDHYVGQDVVTGWVLAADVV